jgi:hypothetical protein
MRFTVTHVEDYVRGDLYERVTGEETDQFIRAVAADALESGRDRVLISVHTSRAIFRVDQFRLPEHMDVVASRPAHRIALVADDFEVRLAHQYIATLARLKGLNVQTFDTEAHAIAWLKA